MNRTLESVVYRLNNNGWTRDKQTATSASAEVWSEFLRANITNVPQSNRVTITYVARYSSGTIAGAGYVLFDYHQAGALGTKPNVTLIHKVTDGVGTITSWIVDYKSLSNNLNKLVLLGGVNESGVYLDFTVEADNIGQLTNIVTNPTFTNYTIPAGVEREILHGNRFWEQNENGEIYNTNFKGSVGIATGTSIDSNVVLDVNGNIALRGDIRLKKEGSDDIVIDSDSSLGYLFGIQKAEDGTPILYIDTQKQVGINTNAPENTLHTVGTAQITERVSIGAGDSPLGKLHVRGEGDTYATMAMYVVNKNGKDLLRVHDDGTVWMSKLADGVVTNKTLIFGNGLDNGSYDGEEDVTLQLAYLIGSPTGEIYTP